MGSLNSKIESQQVILLGLKGSGKTLFLKRIIEIKKNEIDLGNIESTNGYNYVSINYLDRVIDIWDLGGDTLNRSYWATVYRNILFNTVIYFINLDDPETFTLTLKELLILINQEELKQSKFFIIFNFKSNEADNKEYKFNEMAENLINDLRECPLHEFDSRVKWQVIDITKIKDGEIKTTELLMKCMLGTTEINKN
jgi:hypothetical protein